MTCIFDACPTHIAICVANFLCDVLLTVQNGCAVNEKDLKC